MPADARDRLEGVVDEIGAELGRLRNALAETGDISRSNSETWTSIRQTLASVTEEIKGLIATTAGIAETANSLKELNQKASESADSFSGLQSAVGTATANIGAVSKEIGGQKEVFARSSQDIGDELATLRKQRQEFAEEAQLLTNLTRDVIVEMSGAIEAFAAGMRALGDAVNPPQAQPLEREKTDV